MALASTNAARLYGLYPRKGTNRDRLRRGPRDLGSDREVTVTWDDLHDNVGYTPYEGRRIKGWPVTVLSRGRRVVDGGDLLVERGSGEFLRCERPEAARPLGRPGAGDGPGDELRGGDTESLKHPLGVRASCPHDAWTHGRMDDHGTGLRPAAGWKPALPGNPTCDAVHASPGRNGVSPLSHRGFEASA